MLDLKNINIKKKSEDRELISNLSFTLNQNDKFAVIGLEGIGKSTLLKLIAKEDVSYIEYSGYIDRHQNKIGYLKQSLDTKYLTENVIDYLLKEEIEHSIFEYDYQLLQRLNQTLQYVQFDLGVFDDSKRMNEFSGGEIVKLMLTKILLRSPDVLLLDEPTNNLDLKTILFFEEFIKNESRPILFISHDETLLKHTCNGVIHLTQINKKKVAQSFFEKCGYIEYKQKRKLSLDSQEMIARKERSDFKKKMERFRQIYQKVEHLQNQTVRDPSTARLLAKKVKSLKSTEKRYRKEQTEFHDIPQREEQIDLFFNNHISIPSNRLILNMKLDELRVKDKVLSKDISLLIKGQRKICIIGDNGSGKTTLLKEVLERLKQKDNIKVGYMSQDYNELLKNHNTSISFLIDERNKELLSKTRTMLGALDFTSEEMLYSPNHLSLGQQSKLLLLKMVIDDCNVLLLDEPTRNLSPLSIPAIHKMFIDFKGVIIAVSHDRSFIENVFDDVYVLSKDGLTVL
jgi:ATPase subunit of ABC transporter with duplicated ATPase domains